MNLNIGIVGCGITGITTAHLLKKVPGVTVTLFNANKHLGRRETRILSKGDDNWCFNFQHQALGVSDENVEVTIKRMTKLKEIFFSIGENPNGQGFKFR